MSAARHGPYSLAATVLVQKLVFFIAPSQLREKWMWLRWQAVSIDDWGVLAQLL